MADLPEIPELKSYLNGLDPAKQERFAKRCDTSVGHLRNIASGLRSCSAELAISIERESERSLTCERLCPNVDWAYVRGTSKSVFRRIPQQLA